MRLFISAPFSPQTLDALEQTQALLRANGVNGSFVPRRNLHMTLAFLGEVASAAPALAALEAVPFPRIDAEFVSVTQLRDLLFCELRVQKAFADSVGALRDVLEARNIPFDRKPFRPHITLVRRAEFSEFTSVQACGRTLRGVRFGIDRVQLMRTDFVNRCAKYTVLLTCMCCMESQETEKLTKRK